MIAFPVPPGTGALQVDRPNMKRLLVWDAPNIDMALGSIFGRTPTSSERPNMRVLKSWLDTRTDDDELLPVIFVNVSVQHRTNLKFHNWLKFLSSIGFGIYAKPKDQDGAGDIDDAMVQFIRDHMGDELREVIIASHDANCFQEVCRELTDTGIKVAALGFTEQMNGFDKVANVELIDLETIPGMFSAPLPREINIWNLPPEGKLLLPVETSILGARTESSITRMSDEGVDSLDMEALRPS